MDQGTNGVAQWLRHSDVNVLRFNDDETQPADRDIRLTADDCVFEYGGRRYALGDIDAVWYRKGNFWFHQAAPAPVLASDPALVQMLERRLKAEVAVASRFLARLVQARGIRTLGNPFLGDPNKLEMMTQARAAGLDIPDFEMTTRLSDEHRRNASGFVSKAASDGIYLWDLDVEQRAYFSYTERLDEILGGALPDYIPLSMIQRNIAKALELRIFYLDGRFHATAIFSQNDAQTAVDYRKYNIKTPNRNTPFELPPEIERKLLEFFQRIELNTGSVDMIVTPGGDYVFLEVNPYGIYSGISEVCNLNIDRTIARWLCQEKHEGPAETGIDAPASRGAAPGFPEDLFQELERG